jgi:hypothetical protein
MFEGLGGDPTGTRQKEVGPIRVLSEPWICDCEQQGEQLHLKKKTGV